MTVGERSHDRNEFRNASTGANWLIDSWMPRSRRRPWDMHGLLCRVHLGGWEPTSTDWRDSPGSDRWRGHDSWGSRGKPFMSWRRGGPTASIPNPASVGYAGLSIGRQWSRHVHLLCCFTSPNLGFGNTCPLQTLEQPVEWFQDVRSPQIPDNNWIWFQIIVETFLRGVG